MSESRSTFQPPLAAAQQGAQDCPLIADLIDYAFGRGLAPGSRRIEEHLRDKNCSSCRSWLEKATRLQAEPWPDADGTLSPAAPLPKVLGASPWQGDLFRELEKRLAALEE
jgi:hypothetical protein